MASHNQIQQILEQNAQNEEDIAPQDDSHDEPGVVNIPDDAVIQTNESQSNPVLTQFDEEMASLEEYESGDIDCGVDEELIAEQQRLAPFLQFNGSSYSSDTSSQHELMSLGNASSSSTDTIPQNPLCGFDPTKKLSKDLTFADLQYASSFDYDEESESSQSRSPSP